MRSRRWDALAVTTYLLAALWVTARLWTGLGHRVIGGNPDDQAFNEWMYSYDAYALTHLANPFYTTMQNAPDGVNLMANVALQGPGWLLAPVTLLLGAHVTFTLVQTLNLVATAAAWYFVLSRHLVGSRTAAFLGGAFCAFAPGMVAQTGGGHPHVTSQYLVPLILWRMLELRRREHVVRNGVVAGLLIAAQVFVGEEVLFLMAIAGALLVGGYVASRPADARREAPAFLAGLGVAAVTAFVLVAYPLWVQFFGPGHYRGLPPAYHADLASYVAYARESVGGDAAVAARLVPSPTEENAFFGWPLLVLAAVLAVWLWHHLAARLAAVVAAAAALLSLGEHVTWHRRPIGVPGPYRLLSHLPLFDSLITTRLGLVTASALGVLLAVAADRVIDLARTIEPAGLPVRLLAAGTLVAVLLPVAPTRLPTSPRPPVPHFVTTGHWRDHVSPERTLVPVPVGGNTIGIRWAVAARLGFAVPQGYFLGPSGPDDPTGRWFAPARPTQLLLEDVGNGTPRVVGAAERGQARADARFWRADALVLAPGASREGDLKTALDALYGPGRRVDDVWLWDARG